MGFRIRPGKATCVGLIGIMLVLPNSIWKGPDAKAPVAKKKKVERVADRSARAGVKLQNAPR